MCALDSKPWTHNATFLLISLAKQMAEDFQCPVLKKVEMWKKVVGQMQAKGYDFGAEACDINFRQLKHRFVLILAFALFLVVWPLDIFYVWVSLNRYKTIVDSKKKTGSGTSRWVFFSSMT